MELTVTEFVTLDGVVQAPGAPEEDPSGGFTHGGWVQPHGSEELGAHIVDIFSRADAFLLGRGTYEIFAGYWPRVTSPDDPIAHKLNTLPKYVASTTLRRVEWANSTLLAGDTVEAVRRLKASPGRELQVHGSRGLLQTLLACNYNGYKQNRNRSHKAVSMEILLFDKDTCSRQHHRLPGKKATELFAHPEM